MWIGHVSEYTFDNIGDNCDESNPSVTANRISYKRFGGWRHAYDPFNNKRSTLINKCIKYVYVLRALGGFAIGTTFARTRDYGKRFTLHESYWIAMEWDGMWCPMEKIKCHLAHRTKTVWPMSTHMLPHDITTRANCSKSSAWENTTCAFNRLRIYTI